MSAMAVATEAMFRQLQADTLGATDIQVVVGLAVIAVMVVMVVPQQIIPPLATVAQALMVLVAVAAAVAQVVLLAGLGVPDTEAEAAVLVYLAKDPMVAEVLAVKIDLVDLAAVVHLHVELPPVLVVVVSYMVVVLVVYMTQVAKVLFVLYGQVLLANSHQLVLGHHNKYLNFKEL
jgi:hypothetical protein